MGKIVAVQSGLEHIASRLKEKGYDVVDLGGADEPIDAMVYSEQVGYDIPAEVREPSISSNNQFVVMLNADELEENEILNKIDAMDKQ
jgi:hypothetical protein